MDVGEDIPFVGDPYNLTLVRAKLHEPVPFPHLYVREGLDPFWWE